MFLHVSLTFPLLICIAAVGSKLYSHLEGQIQALHVALQRESDYRESSHKINFWTCTFTGKFFYILEQHLFQAYIIIVHFIHLRVASSVVNLDSFGWLFLVQLHFYFVIHHKIIFEINTCFRLMVLSCMVIGICAVLQPFHKGCTWAGNTV